MRAAWTLAAIVAGVMTGVRLVNVMMMGPVLWKAGVRAASDGGGARRPS